MNRVDEIARELSSRYGTAPENAVRLAERFVTNEQLAERFIISEQLAARATACVQLMEPLLPAATRMPVIIDEDRGPAAYFLTIPWALLVSDNRRATLAQGRARWRTYRERKAAMRAHARTCFHDVPLLAGRLQLTLRIWMPDRRRRDIGNFLKATADALQTVCYADDAQLACVTCYHMGLDRAYPHAEVTVSTLTPVADPERAP